MVVVSLNIYIETKSDIQPFAVNQLFSFDASSKEEAISKANKKAYEIAYAYWPEKFKDYGHNIRRFYVTECVI